MYYDEVQLTTRNVPEVLFLAQKYLIPSLSKICTEFVGNNLTVENTLPVLDHCFLLGVSKGLEKQCWSIIDKHASEVVEDNQFLDIDHGTLTALLSRDTLVAKEMVLFRAAVKWAGHECQRLSIPLTVENKRKVLGDAFYSIRFPLMSMKEFTDEVAQSSFLSHEEVANMYIGFNSSFESCKVKFPTEPRAKPVHDLFQEAALRCSRFESNALPPKLSAEALAEQSTDFCFESCNVKSPTEPRVKPANHQLQEPALRCSRFESNSLRPKLSAEALAEQSTDSCFESCNVKSPTEPRVKPANHQLQEPALRCSRFESNALRPKLSKEALAQQSTVKFKVNRSIRITGVALFTTFTNMSQLFQIELRDKSGSLLMSHSADLTNRGSESEIHDIFFTKGVKLERDVVYSISVVSGDLPVRYGKGPIKEVTCGGVKFEFLDPDSDQEKEKDQIPELLFKPLEEGTLV